MRDYVIMTDSGSDLSVAKAAELGIELIDLCVIINEETKRAHGYL